MQRGVLLVLAAITFVLAVLGALLPIVPATPFLLLTSWLLLRASPRLNERLCRSKLFGPFLRDWEKHHGVRLHVKMTAVTFTLLGAACTLTFGNLPPIGVVALVVLAGLGLFVILRLKTIREPAP